jgi:hypothetical protein
LQGTKIAGGDPVIADYKRTPFFRTLRPVCVAICAAYILALFFYASGGGADAAGIVIFACLAALPVFACVFTFVSPFSEYRKAVRRMTPSEYQDFLKDYAAAEK